MVLSHHFHDALAYQGLYMLNVSFVGTPNENSVGNFSIRVGT